MAVDSSADAIDLWASEIDGFLAPASSRFPGFRIGWTVGCVWFQGFEALVSSHQSRPTNSKLHFPRMSSPFYFFALLGFPLFSTKQARHIISCCGPKPSKLQARVCRRFLPCGKKSFSPRRRGLWFPPSRHNFLEFLDFGSLWKTEFLVVSRRFRLLLGNFTREVLFDLCSAGS